MDIRRAHFVGPLSSSQPHQRLENHLRHSTHCLNQHYRMYRRRNPLYICIGKPFIACSQFAFENCSRLTQHNTLFGLHSKFTEIFSLLQRECQSTINVLLDFFLLFNVFECQGLNKIVCEKWKLIFQWEKSKLNSTKIHTSHTFQPLNDQNYHNFTIKTVKNDCLSIKNALSRALYRSLSFFFPFCRPPYMNMRLDWMFFAISSNTKRANVSHQFD